MPLYNITYTTSNFYTKPVREAILELMVLPENNSGQQCLSYEIQNSLGVKPQFTESLYGAKLIRFRIPRKFCSFNITVEATVEKEDINPFDCINYFLPGVWDEMLIDHEFITDNYRYLYPTELTKPVNEILPEETKRLVDEDLFQYMLRINLWAYEHITFESGVTTTITKIDEILKNRVGVCQDFTHLFISCMRANGIPARYASGYLNQGEGLIGASAMHAWAEVLLPGTGWMGFDPSNNLLADVNYLKIGHGLDYTDCMPIKGVIIAKGTGSTEYSVKVVEQQTQ